MCIDLVRHDLASRSGTRILEANGDFFALYDPAADLPPERQHPWATVVTSDHPYDATSHLDRPDVFRLNLGLPKERFRELVDVTADHDPTAFDVLFPHPVYGGRHWLCVLNPDRSWPRCKGCSPRRTRSPCGSTRTPPAAGVHPPARETTARCTPRGFDLAEAPLR